MTKVRGFSREDTDSWRCAPSLKILSAALWSLSIMRWQKGQEWVRTERSLRISLPHLLHIWLVPLAGTSIISRPASSALKRSILKNPNHATSRIDRLRFLKVFQLKSFSIQTTSFSLSNWLAILKWKSFLWLKIFWCILATSILAFFLRVEPLIFRERHCCLALRTFWVFLKKRGLVIFLPLLSVKKLSQPTSIPICFLVSGKSLRWILSQQKQINHLPAKLLRRVTVFIAPSIGLWRIILKLDWIYGD